MESIYNDYILTKEHYNQDALLCKELLMKLFDDYMNGIIHTGVGCRNRERIKTIGIE